MKKSLLVAMLILASCSGGDKRAQERRQKWLRTLARLGAGNSAYCTARAQCDDGAVASCFAANATCGKDGGAYVRCGASSFACCDKAGKAYVTEVAADAQAVCVRP